MAEETSPLTKDEPGLETVKFSDGKEIYDGIIYHGIRLPTFRKGTVSRLDELKDGFTARPDDILIYGYMKSGTHWIWEIVRMLLNRTSTVSDKESKRDTFIEESTLSSLNNLNSPRLISTHLMFDHLAPSMVNCKVIVPIRHPKDVAVSIYHHLSSEKRGTNLRCDWNRFIEDIWFDKDFMIYYTWAEYMSEAWKKCTKQENFHPVFYEQLHENPRGIIRDLASYLDIPEITDSIIDEISIATQFDNMKTVKRPTEKDMECFFYPGYTMFRKGQPEDWKNHFTEKQLSRFNTKMNEECKRSAHLRQLMLFYSD